MKKLTLAMAVLVAATALQTGMSQTAASGKSGLYMTAGDFLQGKVSDEIDCGKSGDKLVLHSFFGSPNVTVVRNGQKTSLPKSQLYGYRDCKNRNYRFYNNETYQIIDTAGFTMYFAFKSKPAANGKGLIKTDEYYFSTGSDTPIESLSVNNLKKAFPVNNRFQYALAEDYRSDKDLLAYDDVLKTYRIKYLFSQSSK